MSDVIKLLSDLVAIPSVSSQDNTPVIELISSWFEGYEKTTQDWVRMDGVPGKNLIVKIPGEDSSKSLVFVCHMDTVPTSRDWKTDPFTVVSDEDKLFGLGTCDTKGGTASLIQAALTLPGKPARDTFLVFSGDEEVTSVGVEKLKQETTFDNPEFVFIEPTDDKVLISQRAVLQIDVIAHGLSQHGSYATPSENEKSNAIFKMAKAISELVKDAEEIAVEQDPLLGSNTQNLGVIEGGTARNVMADKCVLKLDRRVLPSRNLDEEMKRITERVSKVDSSIEVIKNIAHPSFATAEDAPLVRLALTAMQESGKTEGLGGFQAWSEAGLMKDDGDVIILGPGSISQAHRANEFVLKEDILKYVQIFQKILSGTS